MESDWTRSSMASVTLTLEEYEALRSLISSERESEGAMEQAKATKKPRKKSPYRKELTRQQRIVQKKHPRMSFQARSTEAHRLTRKKLGIRKKRS